MGSYRNAHIHKKPFLVISYPRIHCVDSILGIFLFSVLIRSSPHVDELADCRPKFGPSHSLELFVYPQLFPHDTEERTTTHPSALFLKVDVWP